MHTVKIILLNDINGIKALDKFKSLKYHIDNYKINNNKIEINFLIDNDLFLCDLIDDYIDIVEIFDLEESEFNSELIQ